MQKHVNVDTAATPTSGEAIPLRAGQHWLRQAVAALRHNPLPTALLLCMGGIYFFAYFQRVAVPGTIFNELQTSLSRDSGKPISAAAVTAVGAVLLYIYAGMQLFTGILADRFGGMRVLLLGGVLMCVGSLWFPWSNSLWSLYASRAVVGLGTSVIYLSAIKEIDAIFGPKRFVHLMGLMICMGSFGGLFGTWPLERVVAWVGWRWALFGVALATAAAVLATWAVAGRMKEMVSRGRPFQWRVMWAVVRNRRSAGVVLSQAILFSLYFLIQTTVGKKFLQDAVGLGSGAAAGFTFAMMGTMIGVALMSGWICRLTGGRRKPLMIGAMCMTIAACTLLLVGTLSGSSAWVFLVAYCTLAAAVGFQPVLLATIKEVNHPDYVAISISVSNTVTYVLVAVVVNLAGMAMDAFTHAAEVTAEGEIIYPPQAYVAIFAGMMALAAPALLSILFVPETRGQSVWVDGE